MLYKVALRLQSVDKILINEHLKDSYLTENSSAEIPVTSFALL